MTPAEDDVLWQLQHRVTPATLRDLAQWTHLPRRAVEEAIQSLRLAGQPIVSNSEGLRLTDDPAEVAACAKRLRSRLLNQARTARALRLTSARMVRPTVFGDL